MTLVRETSIKAMAVTIFIIYVLGGLMLYGLSRICSETRGISYDECMWED